MKDAVAKVVSNTQNRSSADPNGRRDNIRHFGWMFHKSCFYRGGVVPQISESGMKAQKRAFMWNMYKDGDKIGRTQTKYGGAIINMTVFWNSGHKYRFPDI